VTIIRGAVVLPSWGETVRGKDAETLIFLLPGRKKGRGRRRGSSRGDPAKAGGTRPGEGAQVILGVRGSDRGGGDHLSPDWQGL